MANISTRFFGLDLKSPVIAASSSMTGNKDQIIKLAEAGAGAIVLKSIFEEEIYHELQEELSLRSPLHADPEYLDYFDYVIKEENIRKYLVLIAEVKAMTKVPVVASINCISSGEWTLFARKLQEAGADALELNLFICPSDLEKTGAANEQFYFETISKVLQVVTIPVSIKISHYFSNLAGMVHKLALTGVSGITVFNRFYTPDIDVENEKMISSDVLSYPNEYLMPLRWTGILSSSIPCEMQIASVLYTEGPKAITRMNEEISSWMDQKGYAALTDFKGSLSLSTSSSQAWERVQFMKYFGEKVF